MLWYVGVVYFPGTVTGLHMDYTDLAPNFVPPRKDGSRQICPNNLGCRAVRDFKEIGKKCFVYMASLGFQLWVSCNDPIRR